MNSKTNVALSVICVAAVLLLVTAPITASHQTFGIPYKGYYNHGEYTKHRYYSHGHWYEELLLNDTS
ncbi:MAG: hypothetical protein WAM14_17620 [Candidatus Nitrosopolaris sp.]